MPSMSYCRFENTSLDMANCVSDLEEASTFADLDHYQSDYEKRARKQLYSLAQAYVEEYERLERGEELDEEDLSDLCYP